MRFERDTFFAQFRQNFGPLVQTQVDGLNFILGRAEDDADDWTNLCQLSYGLATFMWETAHHFTPITEFGQPSYFDKYDAGTPIGNMLGNTQPGDGFRFRGRGYVQITGRANYQRIGSLLAVDLIGNPEQALDPAIAYRIAAGGMQHGWFTGRKLAQYIPSDSGPQFQPARQIINGMDHASDIAALAVKMEATLRAAETDAADGASA
jgi:predicted chitinase